MELIIEKQANPALGLAHVNGKACFVPLALAGEQVRVEIANPFTKTLQARLLEVLTPSPLRVAPPCPHFGDCGGCNLMHLAPAEQTQAKLAALQAARTAKARQAADADAARQREAERKARCAQQQGWLDTLRRDPDCRTD